MSVPNAPAGQYVPAQNPTKNGAVASGAPSGPLSQLPATTSAMINWTPVAAAPAAQTPQYVPFTVHAGINKADGTNQGDGPPYVAGNVNVGANQVGTNVVLTPNDV